MYYAYLIAPYHILIVVRHVLSHLLESYNSLARDVPSYISSINLVIDPKLTLACVIDHKIFQMNPWRSELKDVITPNSTVLNERLNEARNDCLTALNQEGRAV